MTQTLAFTLKEVSRLTGLSETQLRQWDVDQFFQPTFADPNRKRPYSRIYSFGDIVSLRIIARIHELGVPIPRIKQVGEFLKTLPEASWSSTRFFVAGESVYFRHNDALVAVRPLGQQAMESIISVDLQPIVADTRNDVQKLTDRDSGEYGKIVQNRFVMGGKPVFAGTRVPLETISAFIHAGYQDDWILRNYPRLVQQDIDAAREFASDNRQQRQSA